MKLPRPALCLLLIPFVLAACGSPPAIHDLGDRSFELVDQDSSRVAFPGDFDDRVLVVGFIYTHCPDVCTLITANMSNIRQELGETGDVHFVEISFDPERDTPSVLREYMKSYELDPGSFTMLTGDTASVDSLLAEMEITARKTYPDSSHREQYLMQHTNRIAVMDRQGRVRFEYPGSVVPPENVIEDINRLR